MTKGERAVLLRKYHAAKIAADTAKKLAALIKEEIANNGGEPLEDGGFVAKVTVVSKNTFDTTAFKTDYPELYAKYLKKGTESRLYFK